MKMKTHLSDVSCPLKKDNSPITDGQPTCEICYEKWADNQYSSGKWSNDEIPSEKLFNQMEVKG